MTHHLETAAAAADHAVASLTRRLRPDAGQTAAEYVGIIVIIAAILGVLVGSEIGTTILNGLNAALSDILGGG